ncbi:MAG TPA: putative Ig domain-containing protein [Candidatus Binatia bacterium]
MQHASVSGRIVSGELPVSAIGIAGDLRSLRFARESMAGRRAGAVTSQGDVSMLADAARTSFDVDGTGVKVGVLSDSFNCLGGASGDVTSGDLSTVTVIQDLTQQQCSSFDGTDEGRAMLQIVHDVAPGASLSFATAFVSEASFANNILALKNAGADVIVDDVFYFDEPMFQDGIVAQAVDTVVAGGAAYFSAAGNEARQSYQHAFSSGSTFVDGQFPSAVGAPHFFGGVAHNFGPGDPFQSLTIPAHGSVTFSLQWDTPMFSVSGSPGARNDLDIYLLNSSATQVIEGSTFDNVGADPVEIFSFTNNGSSPLNVNLMIVKFAGATNPNIVKYVYFGSMTVNEFDTQSSTIFGHSNANGAEAVGAAWYKQTPAFGVSPPVLESYSSAGGTAVLFDTDGNSISDARADKPEITAPDGANTTFFFAGDDPESDGHPNFFGTSAAAPHAGGVAALLLQANPTLTPGAVYDALENSAIDMGTAGFDNNSGFGLIQADAALTTVATGLNLALTNSDAPDPVIVGNNVTYTLTVKSRGFIDATGVTLTDTLPANLSLVSATPSQGSACSGTTTITCNLGSILNHASATVTIVATATAIGPATNTATVAANEDDFNPSNNTASQTTTVAPPPLAVGANSLPSSAAGLNYNTNLQITGGAAPYHATVISGALPAGLTLNASTGVISGVATKANNKKPLSFTIRVTDSASGSVSKQFSIVVYPALVSKTKSLKKGVIGKNYAATLKASGGKLPYTWSLVGGSLPSGLAESPAGTITGMPGAGAQGTHSLTFRLTDALGNFKDITLPLQIQ